MGLLFKQYSDPLTFLDVTAETVGIAATMKRIYDDFNEEKLWQLFLSLRPNCSFNEWKERNSAGGVAYANKNKLGTKNEEETNKIVNEANNILKNFKLVKGGKYKNGK